MNGIKLKLGFTLAEVLITLGIIGVVAAMTIPTLMNSTNDSEMRNALKVGYSSISQAYAMMIMDNGGSADSLFSASSSNDTVKDALEPYLAHTKVCNGTTAGGAGSEVEGCWSTDWKTITGGAVGWSMSNPGFVLNNGAFFTIYSDTSGCTTPDATSNYNRCGTSFIDVNGFKKPNRVGKDIFEIHLLSDRISPNGANPKNSATTCPDSDESINDGGFNCTAKRLYAK